MTQAPQAIDWPGIRANAVTLGIRGAARAAAMDLPPDEQTRFVERVMKRASREGWEDKRIAAMSATQAPVRTSATQLVRNVRNGAESMANELETLGKASRLSLARGLNRVSAHVEHLDPETALEQAQNVKATVSSLSTVHGWEAKQPAANVMVSVQMLGMRPDELRIEAVEQNTTDVEQA